MLRIRDSRVSGHHALLRWTGTAWEVRDLGSANGTWVDGQRLQPGQRRQLEVGGTLAFGRREELWHVRDVAAPEAHASDGNGAWRAAEDGLLALPSAEAAEALVYLDGSGDWVVERGETVQPIEDGAAVVSGDTSWTVHLPDASSATEHAAAGRPESLLECEVTFSVSLDEEHVEISVDVGDASKMLPHRAHSYLLVVLARARLEDAGGDEEPGWRYCDALVRDLRIDHNLLNVQLFRARKQFEKLGLQDAHQVIERRRGSGQLRLGLERIRVDRL